MTAQIIYGTDFKAKAEKGREDGTGVPNGWPTTGAFSAFVDTDAVYVGVDLASGPDFTVYAPSQFAAPEKDPA